MYVFMFLKRDGKVHCGIYHHYHYLVFLCWFHPTYTQMAYDIVPTPFRCLLQPRKLSKYHFCLHLRKFPVVKYFLVLFSKFQVDVIALLLVPINISKPLTA